MNEAPVVTARPARKFGAFSASREFYWVAGLSLVNASLMHFKAPFIFPAGLGVSLFIDAIASAFQDKVGGIALAIGIVFDLLAAGVFALFGYLSGRGFRTALIIGMIVYGIDGLLCLIIPSGILFAAFHAFILYKLIQSARNFS
jgi:hypothetical protein